MIPIPIFIDTCIGKMPSDFGVCLFLIILFYLCQVTVALCLLFCDELETKEDFLRWLIPVTPFLLAIWNKYQEIGKSKEQGGGMASYTMKFREEK